MFRFFEEIAKITGLPFEILSGGFRTVNFCNKSFYVEGLKSILEFNDSEVNLKLTKGCVKIAGKNLKIKNLNKDTILVVGEILSVEQSWEVWTKTLLLFMK